MPEATDVRAIAHLLRPEEDVRRIALESVSPKTPSEAPVGTMSRLYGLGPFPFHTERAHWPTPPRYVVFRSIGAATDRPTTLVDSYGLAAEEDLVRELHDVAWRVRWGNETFATHVLTPVRGIRWRMRYDRCCMTVTDAGLRELAARLDDELSRLPVEYHHWVPGTVLIIDNWRVLHGRGTSAREDLDRVLERIVIE